MTYQGRRAMSRTQLAASEEHFDVICDPCNFENQRADAKGFCLNCNQNLCDSCIKVHKKISTLQDHVIQRDIRYSHSHRTSTGRRQQPSSDSDPLTERCPKHPEEIIKLYCNTHSAIGCCVCIPLDHKTCKDVSYIRDVSSGITNSDEVKTVLAELRRIAALLTFSKGRAQRNKQKIVESYSEVLEEIESFKEEIVKYLNELVDDLRNNAYTQMDNVVKTSESQQSECEDLLQEAKQMTSDLDTRSSMGQDNGMFVAVKRTKTILSELKRNADHINSNTTSTPRFVFQRDEKLNRLISSRNTLGKLEVVSTPRDVKHLYDINASSDNYLNTCKITGMAVLPDNRLVVNDNQNKTVSVINSEQGIVDIDGVAMDSAPIDLAIFKDDKIAVTLKDRTYIQVLSLIPSLSKYYTIKVSRLNAGIAYKPDVFLLSPQSSTKEKTIHVCNTSGRLLQTIDANLVDPWYITVSQDQAIIYVSDYERNSLDCISMDGVRISTFTAKSLEKPCGIAIDDDGFVYICSSKTHGVFQLPPTGLSSKKVVTERQGVLFPTAIAYREGRLYIRSSMKNPNISNVIKVYETV